MTETAGAKKGLMADRAVVEPTTGPSAAFKRVAEERAVVSRRTASTALSSFDDARGKGGEARRH